MKCSFSCPDYLSSDTKALDHRELAAAKPRATGEDQMINNSQVYKTITQQFNVLQIQQTSQHTSLFLCFNI